MEINGYYQEDVYDKTVNPPKLIGKKGDLVPNFVSLRDDGSTSSGNWLYCGSYTQKDGKAHQHDGPQGQGGPDRTRPASELGVGLAPEQEDHLQPGLRRPQRDPWDPNRPVIQWKPANTVTGKPAGWEGDIPDGPAPPLANEKDGKLPFIMKPLGVGIDLRFGARRWPVPGALRALGEPGDSGEPDVEKAPGESDDPCGETAGNGEGPDIPVFFRL